MVPPICVIEPCEHDLQVNVKHMKIVRENHDDREISETNFRHKNYTTVSVGIKLRTVRILQPRNGSSILDNSNLHA